MTSEQKIIKALDISKWQNSFDAAAAKAQGIGTVICRCAYAAKKDACWDTFAPAVKAAGLGLGAYGFLTAHYAAQASGFEAARAAMRRQVDLWVRLCKAQDCGLLAIDQELESGNKMALDKAQNTALLAEAAGLIRAAGLCPLVYASASWVQSYIDWQAVGADLWVAYYAAPASDFAAYADGSFPGGRYGDLLRQLDAAGRLFAWQYGSTGGLGAKYGAGSENIDRNWQYKEWREQQMKFEPVQGKALRCTSAAKPKCETFFTPDVNASLGALELDKLYAVLAVGGTVQVGGMEGVWYKIETEEGEAYCLALPDRCRLEDAPAEPQTPGADLAGVLAALEIITEQQRTALRAMALFDAKAQAVLDKLAAAGKALQG